MIARAPRPRCWRKNLPAPAAIHSRVCLKVGAGRGGILPAQKPAGLAEALPAALDSGKDQTDCGAFKAMVKGELALSLTLQGCCHRATAGSAAG